MEVKLIRENPDGSADFSFDMSDKEKEALLCLGILTGIKKGIEEGEKYMVDFKNGIEEGKKYMTGEQANGETGSTLQTPTV